MTNALFGIAHSANDTCQYYVAKLRFEKTIALYRWFTIWSMTNSRKRINVFLRYFFESSGVRAYSIVRIILDNENDWCSVRAVWGSDNILCQHVFNLLLKYCNFLDVSLWGASFIGSASPLLILCCINCFCRSALLFLQKHPWMLVAVLFCRLLVGFSLLLLKNKSVLLLQCSAAPGFFFWSYSVLLFSCFKVIKSGLCFHLTKM